jgi:glycosyltransferase involved in cell wall biosynthesis
MLVQVINIEMDEQYDVSVILCTYNRCNILPNAIESILTQKTDGVRYEVIVVDNNSTDQTRQVIESFIARGQGNLRYVFEGKQGLSHARNAGIENSRAPIIAFFDDDERVAPDWVATIKQSLDEHAEVDFIGGKILPRWTGEPPAWLVSQLHWAPVALTDYGDTPFYSNTENPVCLIGGNLGIRRAAFDLIGLFNPELQRMKGNIGSEDQELLLRLWWAGRQGMYVPDMMVEADVPIERMEKAYHRMWHTGLGEAWALMRLNELIDRNGRLLQTPIESEKFYGVPAFVYSELVKTGVDWLKATLKGDKVYAFTKENRVRHLAGYIRVSHQHNPNKQSFVAEIGSLLKLLWRTKP